jgi:S1-C subfamily serine protease
MDAMNNMGNHMPSDTASDDTWPQPGAAPQEAAQNGAAWPPLMNALASLDGPALATARPATIDARALAAARETSVQVGGGSGVIVGGDDDAYYVLTNAHVVGFFNRKEKLVMPDGAELDGEVVKRNNPIGRASDLAVVRVEAPARDYGVATWGADEPALSSNALQAGFPRNDPAASGTLHDHGRGLQYVSGTVTEDLQSAEGRGQRLSGSYEVGFGADLTSGSSGGGTFDDMGRLIGINGQRVSGQQPMPAQDGSTRRLGAETQALIIDAQAAREFMKDVVPGY